MGVIKHRAEVRSTQTLHVELYRLTTFKSIHAVYGCVRVLWRVAGVPVAGSTNATSTSLVVKLKDVDPVMRNANTMVGSVGFSGVRYTAAIE
jgi:hypothetical protein